MHMFALLILLALASGTVFLMISMLALHRHQIVAALQGKPIPALPGQGQARGAGPFLISVGSEDAPTRAEGTAPAFRFGSITLEPGPLLLAA